MSTPVSQLEELGMSVYVNNFRDERLSVASECHSLSDRELQSLGLSTIGERVRFREWISAVSSASAPASSSAGAKSYEDCFGGDVKVPVSKGGRPFQMAGHLKPQASDVWSPLPEGPLLKHFLEQLTSQSCAIEAQRETLQQCLNESEMPRSRMTESDQNILRQMQYHNQDCMANMGRSMQLIEHFKTIRQPVIDSFDHQVITDKENVPTKTSQLTDQKSQWTVYQQQRSEVESTRRSDIYQSNAGWFSRKPRITVKAQLFCRRKDGLASTVASQMSTMLRTRFNVDNVDLVMETVDQGSSIRPGVPVMVICINTSWLDTDVASALQNLTVNKSMALVVMHHTDIDALPNQSSDRVLCRELTAADYKQLCSIFNMAFLSSKGIYPCDMNKRTVSAIVDFIRQHN